MISERRVCRVLGQHRSTQRRQPRGRADEERLVADMVELTRQYGRYGYRRIAALLRDAGWQVNDKRIERLWRREGLKVPMKQPKKSRPRLNRHAVRIAVQLKHLSSSAHTLNVPSATRSPSHAVMAVVVVDSYCRLRGGIAATAIRPMIMASDDPCGRGDDDLRPFGDVVGEIVQDYLGEIPPTEIIGVLETAKARVISQAIKELRGEE